MSLLYGQCEIGTQLGLTSKHWKWKKKKKAHRQKTPSLNVFSCTLPHFGQKPNEIKADIHIDFNLII